MQNVPLEMELSSDLQSVVLPIAEYLHGQWISDRSAVQMFEILTLIGDGSTM